MPTCKQRDSQNRDKSDDDRKPRKLHIAAGEVGEVCGPGPDDDDRSPVIHLMDGPVEALADDNDRESEHQKWQSSDVPQSQIAREEIAHVCAKDAGEAERRPVSRAKRWQVLLLHADRPLSVLNCKMVAGALHLAEAGTRMDMALRVRRGRRLERQSMKYENRLRKVPDVTLAFWVIKIAATTLGEPAGIPKQTQRI
ncbi:MAG TPA: hypothetical protein VN968_19785 [Bradyrhizobium sp.]|jgi:hypothetical protein|nr:hypothetical protein [Bradyrhizobium sp.]